MTGPEHYREAERLLSEALFTSITGKPATRDGLPMPPETQAALIARARVHADVAVQPLEGAPSSAGNTFHPAHQTKSAKENWRSWHHRAHPPQGPLGLQFQTDGEPDNRRAAEKLLKRASKLPVFWAFVGFGGRVSFLERLDGLRGRKVENAGFFHAATPRTVTDTGLHDGITSQFAQWLTAARAAGILV
ncbi:VWA domain-containing protein [Streptomyces shenzhenensis]|uniref:VWA domain-containing protein n=1 Tax=Streptomyces shenzhenensis TaxID=943815 RepID=UPI003402A690